MVRTITKQLLAFWLLAFFASACYAVTIQGLYSASVPVASQASQVRNQAIAQGLQQVLIKVSGNPKLIQNPVVADALSQPTQLLQQYSYKESTDANGQSTLDLQVRFDKNGVNALLQKAGQAIWDNNRPLVLVWMAIQQNSMPSLSQQLVLASGDNNSIESLLKQDARTRGLPILLPMMDLQDMENLSFQDIWQDNLANISKASQRYTSDAILIARVSENSPSQWQGQWTLLSNGQQENWQTQGSNAQQAIGSGVDQTSEILAARYAILGVNNKNEQSQDVTLTVSNIHNAQAYTDVLNYLNHLNAVKQVEVVHVGPKVAVFSVQLSATRQAFVQAIALDHRLQPQAQSTLSYAQQDTANTGLYYQWLA